MIRPLTIASCLLAFGSGMYLYQSKHEVQLLDRTIAQTVRETSAMRDQSRLLAAEWTMLNDFDRLRQFSDTYLNLKPIAPAQFTSVADLAARLPAPRAEPAPHALDEPEALPIVAEALPPVTEPTRVLASEEALPVPPIPALAATPVVASVVASVVRPVEVRQPERRQVASPASANPMLTESQPHTVVSPPRPIILAASRPAQGYAPQAYAPIGQPAGPPLLSPVRAQVLAPIAPLPQRPAMVAVSGPGASNSYAAPYGGSLLGAARGSMPAAPRPTPVSATYNTN